mmetsp:Transcript_81069/g.224304  ORF Transcript_81069/g.224304 Transcript_81069/m.224304 type:complete len:462 (-) Transcript_81069:358-1743(-)
MAAPPLAMGPWRCSVWAPCASSVQSARAAWWRTPCRRSAPAPCCSWVCRQRHLRRSCRHSWAAPWQMLRRCACSGLAARRGGRRPREAARGPGSRRRGTRPRRLLLGRWRLWAASTPQSSSAGRRRARTSCTRPTTAAFSALHPRQPRQAAQCRWGRRSTALWWAARAATCSSSRSWSMHTAKLPRPLIPHRARRRRLRPTRICPARPMSCPFAHSALSGWMSLALVWSRTARAGFPRRPGIRWPALAVAGLARRLRSTAALRGPLRRPLQRARAAASVRSCGPASSAARWGVAATPLHTPRTMRRSSGTGSAWSWPAVASGTTLPTSSCTVGSCRWPQPPAGTSTSHCPRQHMAKRSRRARPRAARRLSSGRGMRTSWPWSWTPSWPRSWTTSVRFTRRGSQSWVSSTRRPWNASARSRRRRRPARRNCALRLPRLRRGGRPSRNSLPLLAAHEQTPRSS